MENEDIAILGGIELVKLILMLALQEAQRSNMTLEQIEAAFVNAKERFNLSDPDRIPDV